MKTAVMTDTNSSISLERGRDIGAFVLPMPIIIGQEVLLEEIDISVDEYYRRLADGVDSSTSQPTPESVTDMWDEILAAGYDEIVYIPMTSGLSGSTAAAVLFAEDYGGIVRVVDNHAISVTQMVAVEDALKMAREGLSAEEIKERLETNSYMQYIYIMVDDMPRLARGGRVTPAGARIASALNIKPVLVIHGEKLDAFRKVRGSKRGESVIIDALRHNITDDFKDIPRDKVRVFAGGTIADPEYRAKWHTELCDAFPEYGREDYYNMPCSIATHIGVGAVAAAVCVAAS